MKKISEIQVWKQHLGLLPIHINPLRENEGHMMLNGGNGDFCLRTTDSDYSNIDFYSKSWSSSTKNFLTLQNDSVYIYNWLYNKIERVPQKTVEENFNKFYKYLLSRNYKTSNDLVPFIIDIFRQFRNLTFEKSNPVQALNLLFGLLTSLEDDLKNLDTKKWGLQDIDIPEGFGYYIHQIRNGFSNIKPELDIIIRHSAGTLFQEAQKEVLFFNSQRKLFGGTSSDLNTKSNLYSSIHYTPPFLSRTIVENSLVNVDLHSNNLKIFDPACGSSEFLIEVLKQLRQLDYQGNIHIFGWDISETAINTSRFLLTYEKRTIWEERLSFDLRLIGDSLLENWDNNFDLILMNPPFSSWDLLKNKENRYAVREALGDSFIGKKPNQASAFFYKALNHINENGVIGCIIPSSILTLDSYSKLRTNTRDLVDIKLLGKLGNFIFEDALTDVSFVIGKKSLSKHMPKVIWTRNEKGIAQEALRDLRKSIYNNKLTSDDDNFSIYQPVSFPILKESWSPISIENHNLMKDIERFVAEKKLSRAIDIFNVKLGIRTGNNDVFKISNEEYSKIPKSERYLFRSSTENQSFVRNQLEVLNYVWYPYDVENGIMLFTDEKELQKNAPFIYDKILIPNKEALENRQKNVPNWWSLSDRALRLLPLNKRILSAEFGNNNSFALDNKGQFLTERGYAWIPKKNFNKDDYYFYLSVFSSLYFNKLLAIYSRQLAGGEFYDLGKKFTKDIPIPNVHLNEVKNSYGYQKLVEVGKELSEGNTYVKTMSDTVLSKFFYPNF